MLFPFFDFHAILSRKGKIQVDYSTFRKQKGVTKMLTCKIERRSNAFMIRANEQLLPPYAYMTYQPARGRYADFRAAGVRFVSVSVYAGDRGINPGSGIRPFRPGFMVAPGEYDFRWVDEDFRRATCGAAPGEAFILPRLMLEMPVWWEELHPEAQCRSASGAPSHCCFSSEVWLAAAVEAMEHFEAWLNESGWNEYIVGWHLAAGSTEEYIRPVLHPVEYLDYSEASLAAYRQWLADKYAEIGALNAAWQSDYASFEAVSIPAPAARHYAAHGGLRDPIAERAVIDYYDFYNDELARAVLRLCAEGKRITGRKKLMGAFYGNVSICTTEIGHNSMELLLRSPDVDFFASPFCYTDSRGDSVDWPFQATLESASLHGKPWFVEADVRTFLSRPISQAMPFADPVVNRAYDGPVWYGPDTVEGSLGDMLRALMRIMTHGGALWWFDMWGGWYEHEALMDFQKWACAFYEKACRGGGLQPRAQLAVFLDEKTLNRVSPQGNLANALGHEQLVELGFLGAPYDSYLMSDLEAVDPTPYRAALLISPVGLSGAQQAKLAEWKRDGRTVLFTGYPGYFAGALGDGTEIACAQTDENAVLCGRILRGEQVGLSQPASEERYPAERCVGPRVTLRPSMGDVTLARDEENLPVAVLHRAAGYQTFWSVPPLLPAELTRELLLLSGAHIYMHSRDNVYAGGEYVAVHACSDGVKRVYLPSLGKAFDAFTGERLPGTELWVELQMKQGESRLLRLELAQK